MPKMLNIKGEKKMRNAFKYLIMWLRKAMNKRIKLRNAHNF
jgi:hypothetical protein